MYMNDRGGGVRTQRGGDLSDETTDELLKKNRFKSNQSRKN